MELRTILNAKQNITDKSDNTIIKRTESTIKKTIKKATSIFLAATLCTVCTLPLSAEPAQATELSDAQKELRALSDVVGKAQDKYNAAQQVISKANKEIDRLQGKIDAIETKLAPYKEQLSDIAKFEYTVGGGNDLLNTLFTNDRDFIGVLDQISYLEKVAESKIETMKVIAEGEDELFEAKEAQAEAIEQAQTATAEANAVMAEAQPSIDALNEKIASLREEQREYLLGKGTSGGGPAYAVPEDGDVLDYAFSRVGCPYVWGATGPTSFDCSGLVQWCYRHVGKSIPRTTEAMYAAAKQRVPVSQAQPGDILYRNGHVALCTKAGGKEYVHAPHSGTYVRINQANGYSSFTCALRF